MLKTALAALAVAGCSYTPATDDTGDDDAPDAPAGPDAQACFGPVGFTVCAEPLPTGSRELAAAIDTDIDPACASPTPASWTATQPDACVVFATAISIASSVTIDVTGSRPLVLVATGDLTIDGTLDVASHRVGDKRGPGADAAGCNPAGAGTTINVRGGGGAGGSFGSAGAAGGPGNAGTALGGMPGAAATAPFALLRGGCRGGTGALGDDLVAGGGHGGGAVYLVAGGTLSIGGVINASGAGGSGGDNARGGGGGGGSGGMIVLAAPTVTVGGTLIANGGGGGGGADGNLGGQGSDPDAATPTVRAFGGPKGGGNSSAGGAGAAGSEIALGGAMGADGGGGAGGGLGVIRVVQGAVPSSATISPPATD